MHFYARILYLIGFLSTSLFLRICEELCRPKRFDDLFSNDDTTSTNNTYRLYMLDAGDIWAGSEGGAVKIWPWEAIEKSLSLTVGERHMASLLVERSYIDLRSQVMQNGAFNNIFTSDIKHMLSDHVGAKVWTASYQSSALW